MRRASLFLGKSYLPILLLVLASSVLILAARNLLSRFAQGALLSLLFFAYNFGNCIGIAFVHTLAVRRYCTIQLIFTLFSQGVGFLFLFGMILHLRQRWLCAKAAY